MSGAKPQGTYGIDAPLVPVLWAVFGVVFLVLGVVGATVWGNSPWTTALILFFGVYFLVGAAVYWHASLRGKFQVLDEQLAAVRPDPKRMLDLGCGHGTMPVMATLRFPALQATGIDLWRSVDQSGNTPEAAIANAEANGVADRITFDTGDITQLPYPDDSFDLVTQSLAVHNIHSATGRQAAVDEAWRVLRPGGSLLFVDISKWREYEARLRALGADSVTSQSAGWRMWWSGPWMSTHVVRATKPAA